MQDQTHGFDVAYALDQSSLLAALDGMLLDDLGVRLATLPLTVPLAGLAAVVPAGTTQSGRLVPTSRPTMSLAMPTTPNGNLTITVTLQAAALSLDSVPGVGTAVNVFQTVGGLAPTNIGIVTITLSVGFGTSSVPGSSARPAHRSCRPISSRHSGRSRRSSTWTSMTSSPPERCARPRGRTW
jgi:hypothetical protein